MTSHGPWRRVRIALSLLIGITAIGTVGYIMLGLRPLDALYQTVITITTVGYREVTDEAGLTDRYMVFTMLVTVLGVGTALYTLGTVLESLVEGQLTDLFGKRRMMKEIEGMQDHVIVCGIGRVGRTVAEQVAGGRPVVVIDRDPERVQRAPGAVILGDASEDRVLKEAGIDRAHTLVAALNADADNLFVTLSARELNPDLFIIARARGETAEPKLLQAGANRVVNPQHIGGARMAAFAMQPHVAEFLDVVMHDGSLEFRLEEIQIPAESALSGRSLREANIREQSGALILALREPAGEFVTNPAPDTPLTPGHVLIAVGTTEQLSDLVDLVS